MVKAIRHLIEHIDGYTGVGATKLATLRLDLVKAFHDLEGGKTLRIEGERLIDRAKL